MKTNNKMGPWSVQEDTVYSLEGATEVTVISDGVSRLVTTAPPLELAMALMVYMGVEVIGATTPN